MVVRRGSRLLLDIADAAGRSLVGLDPVWSTRTAVIGGFCRRTRLRDRRVSQCFRFDRCCWTAGLELVSEVHGRTDPSFSVEEFLVGPFDS